MESSGVANLTISTLSNSCTRMMPRVSRPALPASSRKQGVKAVYQSGSWLASSTSPRWRLVRGTSAVGMRNMSPLTWKASSSNLGSWPVPNMVSRLTMTGGHHSLKPAAAWVSIMKLMRARSRRAPMPPST